MSALHEDSPESDDLSKFRVEFKESLIRLLMRPVGGKSNWGRDVFGMRIMQEIEECMISVCSGSYAIEEFRSNREHAILLKESRDIILPMKVLGCFG